MGTVLCHGSFDLLHLGHIRHLEAAKKLGDKLVVSVTVDEHVRKGNGRPHFTAAQRVEALLALSCVDDVILSDAPDAVAVIRAVRPAIYVKGTDYAGSDDVALAREIAAVEDVGGRFHVTGTEKWSSSRLLNYETYSDEVMAYLEGVRPYRDQIREAFDRADGMMLAFVGETIIDEYVYVGALAKPSKEFIQATVEMGRETFWGGVVAASKQAEWRNSVWVTGPAIRKTRFVDADFSRKLFEVYSDRQIESTDLERKQFCADLAQSCTDADAVVCFDFGHGLIRHADRLFMWKNAKFLAVNAQSNAGNFGFNPVTNYHRADLICVDDPEARLAAHMQTEPIDEVVSHLAYLIKGCKKFIVTHGRNGCLSVSGGKLIKIPAFVTHGVDTMGAGDAFLAVTAPLVAAGLNLDLAAFVGNVAGAIKVGIVGHRRHVTRDELLQTIDALLK